MGVDWPSDTDTFIDLDPWIQRPDQQRQRGVAALGWTRALELCSPLLPHEELGRLLTAPRNELYLQLEKILGLGRFAEAQLRLDLRHKAATEPDRRMREERTSLKKLLAAAPDKRAIEARRLLGKHSVDLDALRALVTSTAPVAAGTAAALAALTEVPIPDPGEIQRLTGALRDAANAVPPGGDATADLADRRGRLLRDALALHAAHGDRPCPVCRQQLAPLAARTGQIWAALRQESNVDIRFVTLPNPVGRQKRVQIKASVDGVDTGAFGVMSTGELHAVTLALFLPRATRPESPFRFVVLDDPVQAMDPSKIDGFVRVLAGIAADRQVVVFSHDDRLPEAARRLAPDTRIVEVTRAQHSVVTVDPSRDPAQRALTDAHGLLDDPRVPDEVRRRVLPGLCRSAFESAARDAFYARAYAAGWSRDDVERVWNKVRKGSQRVTLARHADADVDVSTWIGAKPWRRGALDVCGRAVHLGLAGHPLDAVSDVRKLVADLRAGL